MSFIGSVLDSFHDIGLYDSFDLVLPSGLHLDSDELISVISFLILSLSICLLVRWMYLRIVHPSR